MLHQLRVCHFVVVAEKVSVDFTQRQVTWLVHFNEISSKINKNFAAQQKRKQNFAAFGPSPSPSTDLNFPLSHIDRDRRGAAINFTLIPRSSRVNAA
jgi:hypothetical protein